MKLYHYTKFDTFIYDILPNMKLKFFSFSGSNDPFEFSRLFQIDLSDFSIQYRDEIANEYFRQMDKYRFVCFSKDRRDVPGFKLPTMWAHYGEKHKGVCLEIDLDKIDFSIYKKGSIIKKSVKYDIPDSESKVILGTPVQNETPTDFIRRSISEHVEKWESANIFTKLKDWKIENEYRIVYKNDDNDEHYLDISQALTHVYLGINASKNWSNSVKIEVLSHLIKEKSIKIQREIKFEFLQNEAEKINSNNFEDRKLCKKLNTELSERTRLKSIQKV